MASLAPFKTFIAPAAKIIARLRDSLTYNNVPCTAQTRPYLGHVPYFVPKLSSDIEHRER